QLFWLAAVPAPVPITSSSARSASDIKYTVSAAHSKNRTDARLTAYAPTNPKMSQRICDAHAWVAEVGTSVWPAEYTIAMPYADKSSAVKTSGTSTTTRRDDIIPRC